MAGYLGIDPGGSGAFAILTDSGNVDWITAKSTPLCISNWLDSWIEHEDGQVFATIEQVAATPQMGVTSAFTFGASFGLCLGLLTGHAIPFQRVSPIKWQNEMKCRTGGDKNVSKRRAQELFPAWKITHANADALLLALYCSQNVPVGVIQNGTDQARDGEQEEGTENTVPSRPRESGRNSGA